MSPLADDSVLQLPPGKGGSGPGVAVSAQLVPAGPGVSAGTVGEWPQVQRLARQWGLETVDLAAQVVPEALRDLLPRELAESYGLVPFARHGNRLLVAASDPLDVERTDCLRHLLGLDIELYLAPAGQIGRTIDRCFAGTDETAEARVETLCLPQPGTGSLSADSAEDEAGIIQTVQSLISDAIQRRASDIHLEPFGSRFRVRCRVDGVLQEMADPPKRLQRAMISRLKIMANISIAEKRLPQDGRIQVRHEGRALDLRASTLPTVHGESMVLRILDPAHLRPGLTDLGLLDDDRTVLEQLITKPNGLVLATGPTGSGKTTTLYACLQRLNQTDHKIITVEDPVEYQLSGINQVPVRHESGLTFSSALRAMLRQAPNTVMVGEIRDRETAEIALHASLTGHLVFSTLHTSDATGAIARLLNLGVKPFLLSGSLRAVLAQRLVRKVCSECRQPVTPTAAELDLLGCGPPPAGTVTFRRGAGCPGCNGTGYRGRVGIFELLVLTDEISQMIHERPGSAQLRERARALGMRTLREDGARKAIAGLTTIEEVVSMTAGDAS